MKTNNKRTTHSHVFGYQLHKVLLGKDSKVNLFVLRSVHFSLPFEFLVGPGLDDKSLSAYFDLMMNVHLAPAFFLEVCNLETQLLNL